MTLLEGISLVVLQDLEHLAVNFDNILAFLQFLFAVVLVVLGYGAFKERWFKRMHQRKEIISLYVVTFEIFFVREVSSNVLMFECYLEDRLHSNHFHSGNVDHGGIHFPEGKFLLS